MIFSLRFLQGISDASSLQKISQGRFFIPVKDAQRWFHPQIKHYGCNPTGHGEKESNLFLFFLSTVSGSKHTIKTWMWLYIYIVTCILHIVDQQRSMFQETICSRSGLKWRLVISGGPPPNTHARFPQSVHQAMLQIFISTGEETK